MPGRDASGVPIGSEAEDEADEPEQVERLFLDPLGGCRLLGRPELMAARTLGVALNAMSLRDTVERIRSNPPPGNEEMAKFQVLAPILADLSWDPFGQEVRWEHPVGGKKSKGWADIALKADDRIWVLIEAKAPGANLNHHVEQVLGYTFFEGVSICVLTDGLLWRVKQTPSGLWVDTNLGASDIRKRALRLLEALGHRESDLEYVYE